ncbi:MAG: c-type cytochrome [Anaerolineales bacterium]|nr:c-type cytochrome [Anaerolineales bacterium]
MRWQIALGAVFVVIIVVALLLVGATETERMTSFSRAYYGRQIEVGALLFESSCRSCHGPQGKGIEGVAPAINSADLFNGDRLESISWTGTVEDYLRGVIAAGRPVPSEGTNYPQRMPAWGQEFGGPMRGDEIEGLVAYIMNWEDVALAEAGEGTPVPAPEDTIGTDITVELPEGDSDRGAALSDTLGCSGCHLLSEVGPPWLPDGGEPGIGERAGTRITQVDYTGEAINSEEYLIESIVLPDVYVVDGYQQGLMPGNYGDRLTVQEVADLVIYMLTLR